MLKIFKDKSNGKIHNDSIRKLISKTGKLNPMLGKNKVKAIKKR